MAAALPPDNSAQIDGATPVMAQDVIRRMEEEQRAVYANYQAMLEAGERRLRPILMTALATVAGMVPLSLALGAGSQMLQPLAIAVIGGVAVSMILSLLITPVLFFLLRKRGL